MKNIKKFIEHLKVEELCWRHRNIEAIRDSNFRHIQYSSNKLSETIKRIHSLAEFYNLDDFKSKFPF